MPSPLEGDLNKVLSEFWLWRLGTHGAFQRPPRPPRLSESLKALTALGSAVSLPLWFAEGQANNSEKSAEGRAGEQGGVYSRRSQGRPETTRNPPSNGA